MRIPCFRPHLLLLALPILATACAEDEVRAQSVADLQCPASRIEVTRGAVGYVAHGCGKSAVYDCVETSGGSTCFPHPRAEVRSDMRPDP